VLSALRLVCPHHDTKETDDTRHHAGQNCFIIHGTLRHDGVTSAE